RLPGGPLRRIRPAGTSRDGVEPDPLGCRAGATRRRARRCRDIPPPPPERPRGRGAAALRGRARPARRTPEGGTRGFAFPRAGRARAGVAPAGAAPCLRRRRSAPEAAAPPLSEAERARLAELLKE